MSESNDFTNLVITEDELFFSDDNVSVSIWHYVKDQSGKPDARSIGLEANISKKFLAFLAAEKKRTNRSYVTYKKLDAAIKDYLKEKHEVTDPVLIVIQHAGHGPYLLVDEKRLVLPSPSPSPSVSSPALSQSPCPDNKVRVQDGVGGSECLPRD